MNLARIIKIDEMRAEQKGPIEVGLDGCGRRTTNDERPFRAGSSDRLKTIP
jgi:hypothetical protein